MRNRHYNQDPRIIIAKFESKCAETGQVIHKGDEVVYYPSAKAVYCEESKQWADFMSQKFADDFCLADANW